MGEARSTERRSHFVFDPHTGEMIHLLKDGGIYLKKSHMCLEHLKISVTTVHGSEIRRTSWAW